MGEMIKIHQQTGTIQTYRATSDRVTHFNGAIIVGHELWGLTEQIKRVADRLAGQGYLVLAPDLFSTDKVDRRPSQELQKRLFSTDEHVRYRAMPELRALIAPTQTPKFKLLALSRLESCFEYLYNQPLSHQKVSMVGFGLSGDYSFELAMREQRLYRTVSYYGTAPKVVAELRHIKCQILAFYGSKEASTKKELDRVRTLMKQGDIVFMPVLYDGAGHGFFNDENSFAYNPIASDDSWRRMLQFLGS